MKRVVPQTGMAVALALLWACDYGSVTLPTPPGTIVGSGLTATESRPVGGFAAATVSGPLRLVLRQGGGESLEVTADDNVLPLARSEVRDGRLFLGLASGVSLTRTREIVCRVTVGQIHELEASGAARVEISGIDTDRFAIRLSGATTLGASGAAGQLELDVSGASRADVGDLRVRVATAGITGASYALVRVSDTLVASVSGASVLEYLGDPLVVPEVSGASVLRRVGP